MKLETHASHLTPSVLKEWDKIIRDLVPNSYPVFRVRVKGLAMTMNSDDILMLMGLNTLEDCSLTIDTEGECHEIIIRDTFERI